MSLVFTVTITILLLILVDEINRRRWRHAAFAFAGLILNAATLSMWVLR